VSTQAEKKFQVPLPPAIQAAMLFGDVE